MVVALAMAALGRLNIKSTRWSSARRGINRRWRANDSRMKPPNDDPMSQAYRRGCEEWVKKFDDERAEEPPNQGRILPSLANNVTRRPAWSRWPIFLMGHLTNPTSHDR